MPFTISVVGGIYVCLLFIHFFVDFLFQSQQEAISKHDHPYIRARHCLIYSFPFLPILFLLRFSFVEVCIALNILFWSHFAIDTYILTAMWAKYCRKAPEMFESISEMQTDGTIKIFSLSLKKGLKQYMQTVPGFFLAIVVDQIFHLTILWVIVLMAMRHI